MSHNKYTLCPKCNWGIGYFNDNPDILIRAAEYLKYHDQKSIQIAQQGNVREGEITPSVAEVGTEKRSITTGQSRSRLI